MQINLRHKISSVCIFSKRQCKQSILWRQSWRWWWQWWRWSGGRLPWCWWRPALPAPRATSSSAALAFRKAGREDMRHAYLLFESSCSISVVVGQATILWNSQLLSVGWSPCQVHKDWDKNKKEIQETSKRWYNACPSSRTLMLSDILVGRRANKHIVNLLIC